MASPFLIEREQISLKFLRPPCCHDCIGNPLTETHNPLLSGAFIQPLGSLNAQLIIIGISGGVDEERLGKPFVGPSGWALDAALDLEAHPTVQVRKYNIYNCRALQLGTGGNHVINRKNGPSVKEMRDCCSRWLFPELKKTKAKIVLILGTDAYRFLMAHRFDAFSRAMGHRLKIVQAEISSTGIPWSVFSYGKRYSIEKVRRKK